jgi:acetyl esterase/lipase
MISEEAQKSIKKYKQFASITSSLYKTPGEITRWRINLFRWLINLQGTIGPKVKGTIREELDLGGIRTLKVSTPKSDPQRIFLYYHGGGYAMGSPESHYSLVSYLADITGTTVYVPDYRLGPEYKYPAQLELSTDYFAQTKRTRNRLTLFSCSSITMGRSLWLRKVLYKRYGR